MNRNFVEQYAFLLSIQNIVKKNSLRFRMLLRNKIRCRQRFRRADTDTYRNTCLLADNFPDSAEPFPDIVESGQIQKRFMNTLFLMNR